MVKDTLTFSIKRLLGVVSILLVAIAAMITFIFIQFYTKPKLEFYALDADEEIIEPSLIALDEPNVSTQGLLSWASVAATAAYTLDFQNYETKLASIREYFTQSGYDNYLAALDAQGKIDDIVSQQLLVTSVISGTPVVLSEGILEGRRAWKLQLPLLVTYQGASEKSTRQNIAVNMMVTRVPTTDAPKGIGIVQFVDRDIGS